VSTTSILSIKLKNYFTLPILFGYCCGTLGALKLKA
jgi:hypothetical protein